ncbi:MAG TPA: hypothetical protein VGM50_22970 [Gemmatimonadaceae bacterium]|jgi:hypothetical protein
MTKPAPHARTVRIRVASTGQIQEVWPVDARELVKLSPDEYSYATDEASPATADTPSREAATPPTPPKSIAERLGEKSYKELQVLAKRASLNANQKQAELIDALVPHIAGGAITLEEIPKLALDPVQFPNANPE